MDYDKYRNFVAGIRTVPHETVDANDDSDEESNEDPDGVLDDESDEVSGKAS